MALQKQPVDISFAKGLDTKTDPKRVSIGKFLSLQNSVFTKGGLLQKRNGYAALTLVPDSTVGSITTFNGNLTAIGDSLLAYSRASNIWVDKGSIRPLELITQPLYRSSTNQTQIDAVIAPNGLICSVFTDNDGLTNTYKYVIADSVTGQNIVHATAIVPSAGAVTGGLRVFVVGTYFIICFTALITATNHLQYVAINSATPSVVSAAADISAQYTPAATVAFDGVVVNRKLYLAWNGSDMGGAIRMATIDAFLSQSATKVFAGKVATMFTLASDTTGASPLIYVSFYDSASMDGYTLAVDQFLNTVFTPHQIINGDDVANLASAAQNGSVSVFIDTNNVYSYNSDVTNYIQSVPVSAAGTVGATTTIVRSVGLASKAFIIDELVYMLAAYESDYQPTYFLIDDDGNVISKLAYSNGGGYLPTGLASVSISDSTASIAYLYKSQLTPVNKTQGVEDTAGVYAQLAPNLATFSFDNNKVTTAEIGHDLHLSGGFLWMYDGAKPVEHLFHLWPDNVDLESHTAGGSMTTQDYFYVALYEWSDAQGNIFRSAPSVPMQVPAADLTGSSNSVLVSIPTLRLTYKIENPVKIVVYRWSMAQQTYFQVTSVTQPVTNVTTIDSVQFLDTQADSAIAGNSILYTTGGVVENIAAPATTVMALYKSRVFLVDAEDRNLLWFSKQVIENTPVETSDLFTIYVAPTIGEQGDSGGMTALYAMDDKLIIFKRDAIYYITGNGPDNTGAQNDFSEPVFITSTIGCENQASIVLMPQGLMFQSDKGIWLLGRDLSTTYIGAAVENFNDGTVQSALTVPGTNQVRFTLDTGITLMYDYYYQEWGTFVNVPAISSTLYQNMHTYVNSFGQVFQETVGRYMDGSRPVLMSFKTGWLNLAGLQGYERAYYFYLLGTYISPHKLSVQIAYDYNFSPSQSTLISPDNFGPAYGGDTLYGNGAAYGGPNSNEQYRVFLQQQKCQAFQISITEQFDPSKGVAPGAGLTLSGLNVTVGLKDTKPRLRAAKSVG